MSNVETIKPQSKNQRSATKNTHSDNHRSTKMPNAISDTRASKRSMITLFILVYINLLNYMDRYTVSSVLTQVQKWFQITKKEAGLLQTVFVVAYLVFAPIFGYLGDRFSRKYVMAFGITIWSITTFAGSLMGRNHFWGFFALRGLVGIGEASYSTVAPTIIADLFIGDQRSRALSLFYFAIPCGSGLGYIVGSKVSAAFHDKWQWSLRVTPVLGAIAVILVLVVLREPKRGILEIQKQTDGQVDDLSESTTVVQHQSYRDDLKKILNVPSFNWATLGYTMVSFTIGALAWWSPEFGMYSMKMYNPEENKKLLISDVSYIFGIVTFVAGVIGVTLGAELARRWRRTNMQADALVCGLGIIGGSPFIFLTLYMFDKKPIASWILLVIGEILLFLNWAPNGDLLLYVIPPSCRSSAEALQIVLLHLLGDAISPFIIGAIADRITNGRKDTASQQMGLLYALYSTPFICCIGGLCYLICGRYLAEDKKKAEEDALVEADIPPISVLDNLPNGVDDENDENIQVSRTIVPDIYDHIQYESDNNEEDDEDDGDQVQIIPTTKIIK